MYKKRGSGTSVTKNDQCASKKVVFAIQTPHRYDESHVQSIGKKCMVIMMSEKIS